MEDFGRRQPKVIPPAPNMFPGRPALPPTGQGCLMVKAQRLKKLFKKISTEGFARSRVLLLLYWFTYRFSYKVSVRI